MRRRSEAQEMGRRGKQLQGQAPPRDARPAAEMAKIPGGDGVAPYGTADDGRSLLPGGVCPAEPENLRVVGAVKTQHSFFLDGLQLPTRAVPITGRQMRAMGGASVAVQSNECDGGSLTRAPPPFPHPSRSTVWAVCFRINSDDGFLSKEAKNR